MPDDVRLLPQPAGTRTFFAAEFARGEVEKLDGLKAWAEEHPWRRAASGPPGVREDRVRGILVLEGDPPEAHVYTVVFTITETSVGLMRHASVSCDSCRRPPTAFVVWVLMQRLGYRGRPESWCWREHPAPLTVEILEPFTVQ